MGSVHHRPISSHRAALLVPRCRVFDVYNKDGTLLTPVEMKAIDHHDMDHSGLCMKELCT